MVAKRARRAIIYARVSTQDQKDKGYSLPGQVAECERYAEREGFEVVKVFEEDHSGGTAIAERPKGKKLVEMLKHREADAVIAWRGDRLGRDDLYVRMSVREWLDAGIEVHTLDLGRIRSDRDIRLVMTSWMSAEEKEKIRIRTMAGKRSKALAKRVGGGGREPYGYRFVRDETHKVIGFEIVEGEAKVVRLIFVWYVKGDETGKPLTARAIAYKLSQMHIASPGETRKGFNLKREGGIWTQSQIWTMLKRETYAGVWYYGRRIGKSHKLRSGDDILEETTMPAVVAVNVPAIVDRELWDAAQARMQHNKQFSKRNSKRFYMLSGMVKCGLCEKAMAGNFFSNHRYYSCTWSANHLAGIEEPCKAKSVRADALEPKIWQEVRGLFEDLDSLWDKLKAAQAAEAEEQQPKQHELELIGQELVKVEKEADGIAAELPGSTGLVRRKLEARRERANLRFGELVKEKAEIQTELSERTLTDDAIETIMDFARRVRKGIHHFNEQERRQALEWLRLSLTIKDGCYHAKTLIWEWDGTIPAIPRGKETRIALDSR